MAKKQDINEVVFNALSEEENTFHSSLLVASKIMTSEQINKAIVDNGFHLSIESEEKERIESEITEIETLIESVENNTIKQALLYQKESLQAEIDKIGSESVSVTASSFQETIDKFFASGLNGLKNKSMLSKTEAECVDGTSAVNFLFRKYLIEKRELLHLNTDFFDEIQFNLLKKTYTSRSHIKIICQQLKESNIVSNVVIRNKKIFIAY